MRNPLSCTRYGMQINLCAQCLHQCKVALFATKKVNVSPDLFVSMPVLANDATSNAVAQSKISEQPFFMFTHVYTRYAR